MEDRRIKLPFKINKPILGLGSQTKNTVCFASGKYARLSKIHSDLACPDDFFAFEKDAQYFLKKNPAILAFDLHPEYQSTQYALTLRPKTYGLRTIQHHHAHIASCMVDNAMQNCRVIGVAFDGTGLGSDNRIWGGEFLICDYGNFTRKAHLKEIPLLGAEMAVWEPERLAFAWLYAIYGERLFNLKISLLKKIDKHKWQCLKKIYLAGFNSPLTSSMGRLFDAASSIIFAEKRVSREAELPIQLEKVARHYYGGADYYNFKITKERNVYILDPALIFKGIVADLKAQKAQEYIAYKYHFSIARMTQKTCLVLRKEFGSNRVVLSGGVFQNNLLLDLTRDLLYKEHFRVIEHKGLSANDSSIAVGQIAISNVRSKACV